MGRFLITVVLGIGIFAGVAWYNNWSPVGIPGNEVEGSATKNSGKSDQNGDKNGTGTSSQNGVVKRELGNLLYKNDPFPKDQTEASKMAEDPVIVPAHLVVLDKLEVPSPLDGKLLFIGEGVPNAVLAATGAGPFMNSTYETTEINRGKSSIVKFYRRLYDNQVVYQDQVVAMLDTARSLGDIDSKTAKLQHVKAQHRAAKKTFEEAKAREVRAYPLWRDGVIPLQEYAAIQLTRAKFYEDYVSKGEEVKVAQIDLDMAEMLYNLHFIRSELPVQKGIVKMVLKDRGAEVKKSEPIMKLYSTDRLQAEGMIPIQYLPKLQEWRREGVLTVALEPTVEVSPKRVLKAHRKEITSVAVSRDNKVVSGSEDQIVVVWDPERATPIQVWRHQHPVRVVTCSPLSFAKNLCLVGLSNGDIYMYDLDTVDRKPIRVLENAHSSGISALAFSPNGEWFASGGEDHQIRLWTTKNGKAVYGFDREDGIANAHKDNITSLHFTPQCKLISSARDNTIRVWTLHDNGAKLDFDPIIGRSGSISQLGVSQSGKWMLFDQGRTLQFLSVKDGHTTNVLENPSGAIPFETSAVFSPNDSLLLSAGAPEGRLLLWRVPREGERGYEVRQFTTLERSSVTSVAFSPEAGGTPTKYSFAVSGTKNGFVYLWEIPKPNEVENHRVTDVKLSLLGGAFDAATNLVRVGVTVRNGGNDENNGPFLPGRPVTIVFEATQK